MNKKTATRSLFYLRAIHKNAGPNLCIQWRRRKIGQSWNPLWVVLHAWWSRGGFHVMLPFSLLSICFWYRQTDKEKPGSRPTTGVQLGFVPRIPRPETTTVQRFYWEPLRITHA